MQTTSTLDRITLAIYQAIDEVNNMPGVTPPLEHSPDTAIIGEDGQFDSLVFVSFVTALEESVESAFGVSIAVLDIFTDGRDTSCTVAQLASAIHEMVDGAAR